MSAAIVVKDVLKGGPVKLVNVRAAIRQEYALREIKDESWEISHRRYASIKNFSNLYSLVHCWISPILLASSLYLLVVSKSEIIRLKIPVLKLLLSINHDNIAKAREIKVDPVLCFYLLRDVRQFRRIDGEPRLHRDIPGES